MSSTYSAVARYKGEDLRAGFSATYHDDPEGAYVEGVTLQQLSICGVDVDATKLPEEVQAAILELADDLEFQHE